MLTHTYGYQHVYEAWQCSKLHDFCGCQVSKLRPGRIACSSELRPFFFFFFFQRGGVMFSYALCNGELLFSLPSLLNGPHHSNMWQWSIWMSLTRMASRSSLHSPHSLNRSNWIKETGGVRELLVKQTKGLLTSPMTLYLQERLRELCHLQSNLPLWWCKNK